MELISPDLLAVAKFLADVGQFGFGLVTVLLTIYAATFRRKEIFRSELDKRQLEELTVIRQQLQELFFEFYFLPSIRSAMELMKWSIDDMKSQSPDDWDKYNRYSTSSLSLFYKFQSPDYFLFPKWLDRAAIEDFHQSMRRFAPFTLISSTSQSDAQRTEYMNEIQNMISYLDKQLRQHS